MKKSKKKKLIPVLIILLFVPAAAFSAAYYSASKIVYYAINFSETIAITGDGFSYATYDENGVPEILKLDSRGEVTDIYAGARLPWSAYNEIEYISGLFNCGGTIFFAQTAFDALTGQALRQSVYRLDGDLKPAVFYVYGGKDYPRISYIDAEDGMLFVTLLESDGQTAYVDSFDLSSPEPAEPTGRMVFESPFNDRLYTALYFNNSLYASTAGGEVLRYSGGITANILNSPVYGSDPYGVIEVLGTDEDGVFFYDAVGDFAYHIDALGRLSRSAAPVADIYAIAKEGDYTLTAISKKVGSIMRIAFQGETTAEFSQLKLPPVLVVKRSLPYALMYASSAMVAVLVFFAIIKAFEKSQKLLFKFLFIITPLTLLAFAGFGYFQYNQLRELLLLDKDSLTQHYNRLVAASVSSTELDFIQSPQAFKRAEYARLLEKLNIDYSEDGDGNAIKNDIFIIRDGIAYAGVSFDYPCLFPIQDLFADEILILFSECTESGRPVTGLSKDFGGDWSTTVSAIKDGNGNLAGYVMTRIDQNDIEVFLQYTSTVFALLALIIVLPLLAVLALIFRLALRPVKSLRLAMGEVLAGHYEVRLNSVTRDEFLPINLAFNKMCSDLKTQMYKLERISDSYYRFVPRNILPVLGKKSILDVNYGDSVRLTACCCALCIHNLHALQAAGTDEDFLAYIGMLSGVINESLKKFGGVLMSSGMNLQSLLAVFPPPPGHMPSHDASAKNCAAFAESIRQFCLMESAKFHGASPKATALLHKTGMLYGIAGAGDAAAPFFLSGGVTFIMHAAPMFENTHAEIVMTRDILPGLPDMPVTEIGWRETPDGEECRLYIASEEKTAADKNFSKALTCFYSKDFYNARALFSSILRAEPANGVAKWYALAADKYLSYPQQFISSQLFGTDIYQIDF